MIKLTSIESNRQWLDGGSMFGNAPRALWANWTEVDEKGRIPLACRCLLVEYKNLKILCETGIGAFFEPKLAQRFGVQNSDKNQLLENLNKIDISPGEIDYVILSHLHFDHAGGLLPAYSESNGEPENLIFPKAQFIVGENAWQRALNPHYRDRASFVPPLNKLLQDSGRLHLVQNLKVPAPLDEIMDFFESQGHTPGQMHTIIKGSDQKVVFAGDLIPGIAWVHLPITMGYDRFPEKLIEEKQALYDRFLGENFQIFFTHDPKFAIGRLDKNDKGQFVVDDKKEFLMQHSI